jgi:hypothetical protein
MNQVKDSTTVGQVDVNIDELFGMPGAESIMLPSDEGKTKNMFSKETIDTTFLDKSSFLKTREAEKEVEEALAELDDLITQEEDAGNKGRPKVDKSGLAELAQKMIEEGSLVPFDDDKSLDEYTTKDLENYLKQIFKKEKIRLEQILQKNFLMLFQKNFNMLLNM